ncbi:MAG: sigma-70 family RNA polymerase sigma factor [Phycisphaerae bacterium]|nr:sigma-70 family RNA polymerase sigma factor [Phycisphaerae bacterium]
MDAEQLRAAIASAQAGEAEGYQALLDGYGSRLFGYFIRATGNSHDAEDMLSELMLRLVRQLGRYDHRGRFEPWLFRIAANMVRDRIRRRKVRPTPVSLSAESSGGAAVVDGLAGQVASVDAGLLAGESSAELQAALDGLDAATREMVLLRYFGELSFKELSKMFECPIGTVLARVHRGLRTLREIMTKRHED